MQKCNYPRSAAPLSFSKSSKVWASPLAFVISCQRTGKLATIWYHRSSGFPWLLSQWTLHLTRDAEAHIGTIRDLIEISTSSVWYQFGFLMLFLGNSPHVNYLLCNNEAPTTCFIFIFYFSLAWIPPPQRRKDAGREKKKEGYGSGS